MDGEYGKYELIDTACHMIDEYILNHLEMLQKPEFHMILDAAIFEGLKVQFENIYDEEIEEMIYSVISCANRIYFTSIMPRRSYKTTFVKDISDEKMERLTKQITYLRNLPQPEQRTDEWYKYRHNLVTASNAWKGLSSQSYKNNLIYEKCKPIDTSKYDNININSPFHWGTKYEPLSVMLYEKNYDTIVEDFGCIQDKHYKFLGASPDGINVDPKSKRYGRMLEIKNRYSNSVPITGVPKLEYWIQMQLQMSVCELNECDFLETRFIEYENKEAFDADGTFTHTKDGKQKGIYFCMLSKSNKPLYFYPPLDLLKSQDDYDAWEKKTLENPENADYTWFSTYYWKLEKLSCVLVMRNDCWFEYAVKELRDVWSTIEKERITGYEHRAPNKRKPNSSQSKIPSINVVKMDEFLKPETNDKLESTTNKHKTHEKNTGCLINIESLLINDD